MENCLVTQFKGVVDNDNLPIFDAIVLQIHEVDSPTDGSQWFNVINDGESPIEAEIIGDGYFVHGNSYAGGENVGKVLTNLNNMASAPYYYFSNGNYKVIVRGKYKINTITGSACIDEINFDDFKYNNVTTLNKRGCKRYIGNLNNIKTVNILILPYYDNELGFSECYGTLDELMTPTRVELSYSIGNPALVGYGKVTGNVSAAVNSKETLTTLDLTNNDGVFGDIAVLGQCTNLTALYVFRGCSTTGTIESLIATFRANGKTTGSITTQIYDNTGKCQVTFNGQAIPNSVPQQYPLEWTATTITCNGVTIEA